MVEELKLAIKIDDASIEQSLLKQFANAQKIADKVVLDFKNVNFDDKQIEAKFKEMQKKAGQNPIDLTIGGNTLDMLGQIDKRLSEIFSIGKGKSFIDSSSTVADIGKIENKINELNKKYEEAQKKLSSISSGNISGKDVNLVDNEEFKKLSQEVSELKNQFDDLKTHMQLLDDYTVPTDRFFELQSQVEATTVKVSDLVDEFIKLSNAQKSLSSTPQESNISSGSNPAIEQQIKSESELNAEIEKRENIIRELQQLQEKLTVHEDFHGNDRYFADQLPTEEEIREADKRIKQLTGTNNIFDVDKLIQDRNEWLSEVKYSLEEYDDLIKANDQKALDEYTTRGLSRIGGAESFFGYEDNNFSIASKFVEEKEKIQNEINDLYVDLDKLDEKMNFDSNNSSVDNTVQSQEKLQSELKETQEQAEKTAQAVKEVASVTTSTEQKKDAFPSTEATASVEKIADGFKEVKQETEKATESAKDYVRTISQAGEWNVDSKVSVVKEKNDGQLETWNYDAKRNKKNITYDKYGNIDYGDPIITTISNYKQLEQTIVKADDKLRDLKKALDDTKEINPNASTKNIEKQIEYQKEYISLLEQTIKTLSQENKYFLNEQQITDARKKAATEYDLKQGTKSDISNAKQDAKMNERDAKQAQIEAENIKLAEQKVIYNDLNDSIDRYFTVSKRIESGKAFEGDYEEVVKLQVEIEKLQNNPVLSQEQLDASQRKLDKIETTLEDIATAKAKSDSVKVDSDNAKNIQAEWDKNVQAIQDYMDAVTKLNNLKVKDKGTGSEANQIALQTENVEKLKQAAWDARQNLSSMQAENPDIIAWKQWLDMMELFDQASKGSAESVAKLKDVLDNIKAPSLDKYENKLSSYQTKKAGYDTIIARFNDGGWTSDEYLKNVQAVKDAVKKYEDLLGDIKAKGGIASEEDVQKLKKYEGEIKKTISTVSNMSASEKGYNFVSAQKELDKIHKILNENSKMSSEAKNKIKAYYAEIESGNPSMSLDRIHAEIMKIYNAEVEAGRAGKSMWSIIKSSGLHQIAAQMAGMFSVYDVINVVRQGINTVRELDTAMTEVRKVSNATETQYASFKDTISSTAKEIATTNKELLNSSADFLRLGYSLDQASDLAKNATLFVNVGDGVDITEATEDMITAMKAFDIKAEDSIKIVDDYNQIGNQFALSASDIGEAMKRSASALEVGNNSFEEGIGMITAMNEIVQDAETTGTSLKVLSLRLRGAKADLKSMGEDTDGLAESTSKLREQIKALSGVDIMLDDNTFKSTAQQVKELGAVFNDLSDSSQAALLEIIAGKSRSNAVAALLKNYQQIDNVVESLGDAEGSAMRENEAIVDSINGRIKVLSATAEEFWQNFIDTDLVKELVSLTSDLLNILTKIVNVGNGAGTLGLIGAGTGIFKFIKNFDWVFKPYIKLSNSF